MKFFFFYVRNGDKERKREIAMNWKAYMYKENIIIMLLMRRNTVE